MKMHEVEKIYICQVEDENYKKYVEKVLIQYVDKSADFFSLPSDYLKMDENKREKERKKLRNNLEKKYKKIGDVDRRKLIVVKEDNKLLKRYVDQYIINLKEKKSIKYEQMSQTYSMVFLGISTSVPPGFKVLNSIVSANYSVFALKENLKRQNLSKAESSLIKKLRLVFSALILGINIGHGASNLSVDLDMFRELYTLEKESNEISRQRELILNELENPFEEGMVTSVDAATNLIMESFQLNPFFDERDIRVAQGLKQYIKENPYFDYERCYETFSSIQVIHVNEKNGNVAASSNSHEITIYNNESYSDEEYRLCLSHELVHQTGSLENRMLREGMTTLIVEEYLNDFQQSNGYYDQVLVTKIFCDLISPEKMMEAYSRNDMGIIETELLKLNPNLLDYQKLMKLLEDYAEGDRKAMYKGESETWYDEHAPKFRERLTECITPYLDSASLSGIEESKIERIVIYLDKIGCKYHLEGPAYFNKNYNQSNEQSRNYTEINSLNTMK